MIKHFPLFGKERLVFVLLFIGIQINSQVSTKISSELNYNGLSDQVLANGKAFPNWEKEVSFSKEYHVNQNHPDASDANSGTDQKPFRTIQAATKIVMPGEKIIIHSGIYRETIRPPRGGTDALHPIVYQAAPGDEVIISGAFELNRNRWKPSDGWIFTKHEPYTEDKVPVEVSVWKYVFDGSEFQGYNPFGMLNILHDREYLQIQKVKMDPYFKRRGMIFINGRPLEQVLLPVELASKKEGAFWVEHNGMTIHVRFPANTGPSDYLTEATNKEQLFVPDTFGMSFIYLKGLIFRQCGNGFPVPQRGIVSSNRGNHWIIEDCIIEWANSLGIDLGNEMWFTPFQPGIGYHIVRRNVIRNCGIGGLQALDAIQLLVEDNLFENIGWQNAEHAWESGAIKFHKAENCLIRRNVFRNIYYAPGIWLDYLSNRNCRITRNVFTGITTARGAVYIEVSRNDCLVDQNVFHDLHSQYWISGDFGAGGSALYTDGSDSIRFDRNFILGMENSGYTDYLNAERIVGTRGGLTRWHRVTNNIFIDCKKHAIEFANEYNFSDGNVFGAMPAGYLKIGNPAPALLLDMESWQKAFGWEKNSVKIHIKAELDPHQLILKVKDAEQWPHQLKDKGPFKNYSGEVRIDPRKITKGK